jgi:hypothetical protein
MEASRLRYESPILNALKKLCGERCVAFSGHEGRRTTDFLLLNLWGDKMSVLQILPLLSDQVRGIDIEIIQSARRGDDYFLVVAITHKLTKQSLQAPERRAKMHHQIASQARRRVISQHLATASEVKKSRRMRKFMERPHRAPKAVVGLEQKPI